MSGLLLAEFDRAQALVAAVEPVEREGYRVVDTYSPRPLEELSSRLETGVSPVRPAMLVAGLGAALFAYGLQLYSAVWGYPINSGGRPLHSWPVFLLVPFEVGIFVAGLAGMIAFFVACGLPRLHHALFAVPGFERASIDRYFLLAEAGDDAAEQRDLRALLESMGATVSRVGEA